jgi:NitT/TauT family transport system substrate-binding protein
MKRRNLFSLCLAFLCTVFLTVSCSPSSPTGGGATGGDDAPPPLVIGYSNWAGWWPWAIAEKQGFFEANGANVELKWFDGYLASMEAFAAGQLDGNSQTLNDTIAFAADAVNGEVVVLVNDNSAGNDKFIVTEDIGSMADLKGKTVALEEGVVGDFLMTLALEENGMSRDDVTIKNLETGAAAAAFAAGQVDAVAAWPPFWQVALERAGSKELFTSEAFPGAIPDLLVMSQKVIDEQPEQIDAIVKTWFDTLAFMESNPEESDQIMAERAGVSPEELQKFKAGTRMFTIADNLEAFSPGEDMKHMPFAAERMTKFMVDVGFIPEGPDLSKLLNDSFVTAYAAAN